MGVGGDGEGVHDLAGEQALFELAHAELLDRGDAFAEACVFVMGLPDAKFEPLVAPATFPLLNAGSGEEHSIGELAALVEKAVRFWGRLVIDPSKPDGTQRKLLDSSRIRAVGRAQKMTLAEGGAARLRGLPARRVAACSGKSVKHDFTLGGLGAAGRQSRWK